MSVEVLELPETDEKLAPITKVKTEIARMRKAFSGLKIKDVNDREGLLKVSTARKEVKAVRVQVEKERKVLVEDALKWQRQVNDAAKEITAELVEIEEPLQKLEDDIIAEKQRIKEEAARVRKEKIQSRCQVIASIADVKFDGVSYKLNEVSIEYNGIETLSDDAFQTKVEEFEAEYQTILTARLEADRIAKEEADMLETQRVEQAAKADELKVKEDKINADREKLEAEKVELNAKQTPPSTVVSITHEGPAASSSIVEPTPGKKLSKKATVANDIEKQLREQDATMFDDMVANIKILIDKYSFNSANGSKAHEDFKTGLNLLIQATSLTKAE
ncbi:hypothetical protein [Dyadobacter chenhuakuii]|uniref:DUF1351 domain-containing protein n=1 Tax=Dyadobacter chenhuakuii TaxID=2909339 RepID=A0A9X1QC50_9BACT|nr:hypothetical protein [Dyadobacter chenhuakuii]MCF2498361.1 hypothetical protein [Dyadobacter chenhuakuii]